MVDYFESSNYIKLLNNVRADIVRFIKGAFSSGVTKEMWANVIIADNPEYDIRSLAPNAPGTSDKDLFIIGSYAEQYQDVPYIQVGNLSLNPNDFINRESNTNVGEYKDDNDDTKRGVMFTSIGSGQLNLTVGAYSQEERNELLQWLWIYFDIGKKILSEGNEDLEIDGNIGVGQFKMSVNESPTKVIHDKQLFKGTFSLTVTCFWEVFMPLEGVWNGDLIEGNHFIEAIQEFLEMAE